MNKLFLPALPFSIGVFTERNYTIPLALPFILRHDPQIDLITQKTNNEVRRALQLYYSLGGYASTPLGQGRYAKKQGKDFLKIFKRSLRATEKRFHETSFLEIGSSYGYLLYLLKQEGAKKILGIEPGNEGIEGSKKYNIPLIQDFFPTKLLTKKFDFIFSHCVLEHIEKPLIFLEEIYKCLNDNGVIFIAVPDSEKKLSIGDPSVIAHQHINYFTANSLTKLLQRAKFDEIQIVHLKERSLLVAWGIRNDKKSTKREIYRFNSSDGNVLKLFSRNLQKNILTIQRLINKLEREGKTIGLYAICESLKGLLRFKKEPRVFESDKVKQGKYITGCSNPIESPQELIKNPVDVLFITPIDYDKEIKRNLKEGGISQKTRLISLKEIYVANSGIKYDISSIAID